MLWDEAEFSPCSLRSVTLHFKEVIDWPQVTAGYSIEAASGARISTQRTLQASKPTTAKAQHFHQSLMETTAIWVIE